MGILNYLRTRGTPWLGARLSRSRPAGKAATSEKITAALRSGFANVTFLPWTNDHGSETEAMRRAYRVMLKEPVAKAALLSKVFGTASLSLRVQPDGNGPLAKKVAAFNKWSLQRTDTGVSGLVTDIIFAGLIEKISVNEKIFRYYDRGDYAGQVGLARLSTLDPDYFMAETDDHRRITGIKSTFGTDAGTVYPADCFAIWQHLPLYGVGISDFRSAYRSYFMLDTVWKLRGIFLDKFTMPTMKGTYKNDSQEGPLGQKLAKMRALSWIAIPDDVQVEAIELSQRTGSEFRDAILDLRQEIVIGIQLGFQHILEGTQTGARASSQTHVEQADLATWYTAEQAGQVLTKQIAPDLTDLNYAGAGSPLITLEGVDDADLVPSLQIDQGLHALGADLDLEELYERYGRSLPTKPENVLKGAVSGPTFGLPGVTPGGFTEPVAKLDDTPKPTITTATGPAVPARRPFGQEPAASGGNTALAGADGKQAEALLARSQAAGRQVFADVTEAAVKRLLAGGAKNVERVDRLFNGYELQQIADALAATNATAELLGRSRIRQRLAKVQAGVRLFAEQPTDFECFADGPPLLQPAEAVDYFKRLVPSLGVDPMRFGPRLERQAFTLAVDADAVLLDRVQRSITSMIETGGGLGGGGPTIRRILDEAGVLPTNPQYSEMVVRTNANEALNAGATREMQDPDVAEYFPVWVYLGIRDGRQGKDHEPHFDRYYPNELAFADVRGDRPFNCRCSQAPIDKYEWADLRAKGAVLG